MLKPSDKACQVIRADTSYDGKQGLTYFCGIAAETVGSNAICMHLLTVPPGGRAKAHLHENHETALYVLEGEAITLYGDHTFIRGREIWSTFLPASRTSQSTSAIARCRLSSREPIPTSRRASCCGRTSSNLQKHALPN